MAEKFRRRAGKLVESFRQGQIKNRNLSRRFDTPGECFARPGVETVPSVAAAHEFHTGEGGSKRGDYG